MSDETALSPPPNHYRASVSHDEEAWVDGINCYWGTFAEAVEWIARWPDAVKAEIKRVPMEQWHRLRSDGSQGGDAIRAKQDEHDRKFDEIFTLLARIETALSPSARRIVPPPE